MNYLKQLPAFLLGLMFLASGIMFFAGKLPAPPPDMAENSKTFMSLLMPTGYLTFIKICEVLFAVLILLPKTRSLGLILMMPICVNILCYEVFIDKHPAIGVALVIVNAIAIFLNFNKYKSILA
jgi:putative oxidoreductase